MWVDLLGVQPGGLPGGQLAELEGRYFFLPARAYEALWFFGWLSGGVPWWWWLGLDVWVWL